METTLEVLVAAMYQTDFSLVEKMNIKADAVIANQYDYGEIKEKNSFGNRILMVSTATRGVGKNRNLCLLFSSADILLFADQDVLYVDNMPDIVCKAFIENKNADVILFGFNLSKGGKVYETRCPENGRIPFLKSLKYGTYSVAVRRRSILQKNIMFTELFGGGCPYSHGEDSDFIVRCFKSGLKVYGCNQIIGCTAKDVSTCFEGYREKYFFDTGALARNTFGMLSPFYILYMAIRTRGLTDISIQGKLKLMIEGYRGFQNGKIYNSNNSLMEVKK